MRTADRHLRSGLDRALVAACAATVMLTVVMSATGVIGVTGTIGGGDLVLALAVAAALSASLLSTARVASPVVTTPTASSGTSGHVEASTAYWCALRAPRRPRRPRAPGLG